MTTTDSFWEGVKHGLFGLLVVNGLYYLTNSASNDRTPKPLPVCFVETQGSHKSVVAPLLLLGTSQAAPTTMSGFRFFYLGIDDVDLPRSRGRFWI